VRNGTFLLVAAVALVALAAGCGSGRLSHDSYVKHANAICADYDARVKKLPRPRTVVEIEAYARTTGKLYRAALGQLVALKPPKEDEATVRTWLARDRQIARSIAAIETAAKERRIPAVRAAIARAAADNRRSDALAKLLGLSGCVG
jgi:hypothetical protein